MAFSDPVFLWLLIPALAWIYALSRLMHGTPPGRRRLALGIRTAVVILLVLALAGLQRQQTNRGVATIFVLDRSASIDAAEFKAAQAFISQALGALGENDKAGLIVFGKSPVIDSDAGSLRTLSQIYSAPDPTATDIAAAIRLAVAAMPANSAHRIVLLTDGNETSGDAAEAASAAAADGVQIDVAPLGRTPTGRGEVLVERVDAPSQATRGQPFELHVIVNSTGRASGTLRVDRDGIPVASSPVALTPGANDIAIGQTASNPGFYRYRATIDADNDSDPRNNTGITYVDVRGRPRVLLVEDAPGSATDLQSALKPHDLDVVRTGADGLPTRADQLQNYDSVVLSDFPAQDLTVPQMTMIASAVRDSGMGFAMIGGEGSFLPGGYYDTPIADALPVDLNIRQRKTYPSTCIEIVIDSSGSMGMLEDGVEKIKIAGTAAASMVSMMSPQDLVGVAASAESIEFVAPLQHAVDKNAIAAQCGRIEAGEAGIFVEPSLEFANRTLTPVQTKVRHLIMLADGDDCKGQEGALGVARQMVAKGMTVSTIAVGNGKDVGFLKTLAAVGKGYFYLASQAKMLQRFITKDSAIMARSAIEEGAFIPSADPGDDILRGIDLRSTPPLYAYDLTSDRPLARTPMKTAKNDPLLAYWQYGLGTSLAFTSDAQPKWARQWVTWSAFDAFWAQAIRETLRETSSDRIQMNARYENGHGQLEVTAFSQNGDPINGLSARVNVTGPDAAVQSVPLTQTAPGRYEGDFAAGQTGGYILSAIQNVPGSTRRAVTRGGFAIAYPPEYQAISPNLPLLTQIAAVTRGRILDRPVQAFRPAVEPGVSIRDLSGSLLLAALILFLLDIAARRLAVSAGELAAWALTPLAALSPQIGRLLRNLRNRPGVRPRAAEPASFAGRAATEPSPKARRPADVRVEFEAPSDRDGERPDHVQSPAKTPPDAPARPVSKALQTSQRLLQVKRSQRRDDGSDR